MPECFNGQCHCGSLALQLSLPHPLKCYAPRACDCDFCSSRKISWLSDPKGSLVIQCADKPRIVRQGSQQADFIACSKCANVAAVTLAKGDAKIGAINTNMLDNGDDFKSAQTASPRKLSAEDKARRWSKIWMPVTING